jgi:uncharacterized protein (TIGR00303 family)
MAGNYVGAVKIFSVWGFLMIVVHTQSQLSQAWLDQYRHQRPHFACVLGFTATCRIPNISAAGLTPADRELTALADGEFLSRGIQSSYRYPLPPLIAGASPAIITKAILSALDIPITILNSGLPQTPSFDCVDLGGQPAACLSTGRAMSIELVQHLWQQGLAWGSKLIATAPYIVIGECVVGGTTTALALLTGLGINANGKVNSSHPQCNHQQKKLLVEQGLQQISTQATAWDIVAAIGDPMQVVAAAMAVAASEQGGVLLAGGTQMLAVYTLILKLAPDCHLERIAVGTTGWVTQDPSADAVGLAEILAPAMLFSAQMQFANSGYEQLQVYDQGFVKEGVGAGGAAITASLYQDWHSNDVLQATEELLSLML